MHQENPPNITIEDVSRRAGVSISTVSRVLNGLDRVHPETRERVLAAARELHYQPSAFAQGLAKQRTHTLGFFIPNISDPFYSEIVRGVEETATAAQYNLIVVSQPWTTTDHHYLRLFTQRRVDGLILVGISLRLPEVKAILQRGFPIVLVQQDGGADVPRVVVDNYGGARAVAEHLIEHGYKRIAYISGSNYTPDNAARLRALRGSLDAHGLSLPEKYIVQGDFLKGSGQVAMRQLLALDERPDAVFAANDQMAVDALFTARAEGLRVPEDIALAGFDDIGLASYVSPPLTTVHQPAYELGLHAARGVLETLKGQQPLAQVVLPTSLVVRQSCGCVR